MRPLTLEEQGTLLIVELNKLPDPDYFSEQGSQHAERSCCPECCASCEVLRDALESGRINDLIRQSSIYDTDWSWQTPAGDVDEDYVRRVWWCENQVPGHPIEAPVADTGRR